MIDPVRVLIDVSLVLPKQYQTHVDQDTVSSTEGRRMTAHQAYRIRSTAPAYRGPTRACPLALMGEGASGDGSCVPI